MIGFIQVQYDELDALFTQFVLNSNVTGKEVKFVCVTFLIKMHVYSCLESPQWLHDLGERSSDWSGLRLCPAAESRLRSVLVKRNPSLLDMRNYLFSRQCALLLKVHKPWEVKAMALLKIIKASLT